MATTHTPLETYLHTSYEPDVDYVDGELEDRCVGEYDHSIMQQMILFWFYQREKQWSIRAIQGQRTRVSATEVRSPDVSVFTRETPIEQVFTRSQLIAIEVLSPEDRHTSMAQKIQSYRSFGVAYIWVVDPMAREGWDCSSGDWVRCDRFEVAGTPISLSLPDLFVQIDEDNA